MRSMGRCACLEIPHEKLQGLSYLQFHANFADWMQSYCQSHLVKDWLLLAGAVTLLYRKT